MNTAVIVDEGIAEALERLIGQLPREKLVMLPDLIDQVLQASGWGNVTIVIVDRRVELVKVEISHR